MLIPYPPSVNNLFANRLGGAGRMKKPEYRRWIAEAGWSIVTQKDGHNRHAGKVRFTLLVRRPDDNVRRDVSNLLKAAEDLVVRQGILADDSQIVSSTAEWVYSGPVGARIVIEDAGERAGEG